MSPSAASANLPTLEFGRGALIALEKHRSGQRPPRRRLTFRARVAKAGWFRSGHSHVGKGAQAGQPSGACDNEPISVGCVPAAVIVESVIHSRMCERRRRNKSLSHGLFCRAWWHHWHRLLWEAHHVGSMLDNRHDARAGDVESRAGAEQLRAARALLRTEQADLAECSGVSVATIKRFEAMDGPIKGGPTLWN